MKTPPHFLPAVISVHRGGGGGEGGKAVSFNEQCQKVELAWSVVAKFVFIADKAFVINTAYNIELVKGKAIPVQGWTGPECSRRLRFSDFKTIGS